jgi:hypothetical protein
MYTHNEFMSDGSLDNLFRARQRKFSTKLSRVRDLIFKKQKVWNRLDHLM